MFILKTLSKNAVLIFITFLLLCLLVLALYWPGLSGPYLLDDLQSIGPTQVEKLTWSKFFELSFQNETGPIGRPLSVASFSLNHMLFGDAPYSYKLTNLGLHLLVGCSLFCFLQLILYTIRPKQRYNTAISFIVAFIWLIHPLQVSTVLYTVQRMTILCHLFVLLSLNCYILARIRQWQSKSAWPWYILFFINAILAVASKETALLLPLYLLLIESFILEFKTKKQSNRSKLKWCYTLGIGFVSCIGALYIFLNFEQLMGLYGDKPFSLVERLYTQSNVFIFYIKLILLPRLSDMGLYHDDFPIARHMDGMVIFSMLIIAFIILLAISLKRRLAVISFGLLWFVVSHLMESTIFPLELVFEHRNYLASIGLILILVYLIALLCQHPKIKFKFLYPILVGVYVVSLITLTWSRSYGWSSTERFLNASLKFHPNSPRVHIEVANWYLNLNLYDLAFFELNKAHTLQPTNAGISLHKVLIHCHAEFLPETLLESAKKDIRNYPITPYVILILDQLVTNLYQNKCQSIKPLQAMQIIQQAYQNPRLKHHPRYHAVLYHLEAGLKLINKENNDARILLMKSYNLYPKRMQPLLTKAKIEIREGRLQDANSTLELLIQNYHKFYAPKEAIDKLQSQIQKEKDRSLGTYHE